MLEGIKPQQNMIQVFLDYGVSPTLIEGKFKSQYVLNIFMLQFCIQDHMKKNLINQSSGGMDKKMTATAVYGRAESRNLQRNLSSALCALSMYSRLCMKMTSFLFLHIWTMPRIFYLSCGIPFPVQSPGIISGLTSVVVWLSR